MPEVIVIMGDGDAVAMRGNHFIHCGPEEYRCHHPSCLNNSIYGMTGDNTLPPTPYGMKSSTTVYSNIEQDSKSQS